MKGRHFVQKGEGGVSEERKGLTTQGGEGFQGTFQNVRGLPQLVEHRKKKKGKLIHRAWKVSAS